MGDAFIGRAATDWMAIIKDFMRAGFEIDTFKDINGNYQKMIDGVGTPYRKIKFKDEDKTFSFIHVLNYDNKDKKQPDNLIVIHSIGEYSPVINGRIVLMKKPLKEVIKYI